jgi:hypothetical protein
VNQVEACIIFAYLQMRGLWDWNVTEMNCLRVQARQTLHHIRLPDIHPALTLYELPEGHKAYPGIGVKTTMPIAKGTKLVHYAGLYYARGFRSINRYLLQKAKTHLLFVSSQIFVQCSIRKAYNRRIRNGKY